LTDFLPLPVKQTASAFGLHAKAALASKEPAAASNNGATWTADYFPYVLTAYDPLNGLQVPGTKLAPRGSPTIPCRERSVSHEGARAEQQASEW
jgi:hypothetical protein